MTPITLVPMTPTPLAPVAPLFDRWIAYLDAPQKTVDTYNRNLRQFAGWIAARGITEPKREDVLAYRTWLIGTGRKPTTVQSYMSAVKLFFAWTEAEGLYPNVAEHVKGQKIDEEHKKDPLTVGQIQNLLSGLDTETEQGARDYAILALMVTTGLRTISVAAADVGDLRTVGDCSVLFYLCKGHDEKAVYVKLAAPVEAAIRHYLALRGKVESAAPLFSSCAHQNRGERMTTRSISRIAKDHMIESGIDDERHTAHSLRHTAATLNLLNGGSLEETKQLLNHKSVTTTMIYVQEMERMKNQSENRIAAAVFG